MIQIGKYYRSDTPQGVRTIKCIQMDADGRPYGIYSISDCEYKEDTEGMIIPNNSLEATVEENETWNTWYNS